MTVEMHTHTRTANHTALDRFFRSDPVLVDLRPALEVVPGMEPNLILTSGPTMAWERYTGGQRTAVLGSAVYEGLAPDLDSADRMCASGEIRVAGCQDYDVVGSLAGVTSASVPVLVVEDRTTGIRAYCTLFEGETPDRLNYGVWNERVRSNLDFLGQQIAPALGDVIRDSDGIRLLPIMQRALKQGDELHSRNTAASLLLLRELFPALLRSSGRRDDLIRYLTTGEYFFLRPAMAASKVMAASMRDVPGSSLVTAMAFSCREFGIQVSGLGSEWFVGELPTLEAHRFSPGHRIEDVEYMGGESIITEVCGLGAFAQACAFTLQDYQGGVETMIQRNLQMYEITAAESRFFTIPYLAFRGTPTGIDVDAVVRTGIAPVMDIGLAGAHGGQIGAGSVRASLTPFHAASAALARLTGGGPSAPSD